MTEETAEYETEDSGQVVRLTCIITAYNRADFVDKNIGAIRAEAADWLKIHIVVMDNGSVDRTAEAAQEADPDANVVRTEDNYPIPGVINRGFEAAYAGPPCHYILVLNDDTQFTEGSLRKLVRTAERHQDAMLTPLQLNYREPEKLDDGALADVLQIRELVEDSVLGRPLQEVYNAPKIIGAAIIGTREAWEQIGEWDETFWFYGVDDDICTRARWHRYRILLVPAAHLYHAHGKLGTKPSQQTFVPLEKWRKETQARYLFRLKDPNHSLSANYASTCGYAMGNMFNCLRSGWPKGAWHSIGIYLDCVKNRRKVAEVRTRHFPPKAAE